MKYLKKFENIFEYKIGDYVYIEAIQLKIQLKIYGKIISINNNSYNGDWGNWNYKVNIFNSEKNNFEDVFITESIIIRKMTSEEIKNFELKKDTIKFNI